MKYLHTMLRISEIEASLDFYCNGLGLVEFNRIENTEGKFTLIFLAAPDEIPNKNDELIEKSPLLELTYNWDGGEVYNSGRNFGHIAFLVDNIYTTCQHLMDRGITINRPPRDGYMAFIKSPDNISIELLQKGKALHAQLPWSQMQNSGTW